MNRLVVLSIMFWAACPRALADSQKQQILKKFQIYGEQLKSELMAGMAQGPLHAVKVCKDRAPEIAKSVSTSFITVGRVSHKPRNAKGAIKDWMKNSVQSYLDGKTSDELVVVKIDETRTGYLMPIKTGALCLTCHGESISKDVKESVLKHYPSDKAVGFKAGEIRGFFFAEVKSSS